MSRYRRNLQLASLMALVSATLALGVGQSTAAPSAKPSKGAVPGELLVGFRSDVSAADQQKILKKAGALEKRKFKGIHGTLAELSPDAVQSASIGCARIRAFATPSGTSCSPPTRSRTIHCSRSYGGSTTPARTSAASRGGQR